MKKPKTVKQIDRCRIDDSLVIAVTGLNTGENPQPGVPVIRSLRNANFNGRIIGLVYDTYESGIYAADLADEVYIMPYPSEGLEVIKARLEHILKSTKIDVLIPTLDLELPPYIQLEKRLNVLGIKMFLPTKEQFMMRDKTQLSELTKKYKIKTPQTFVVSNLSQVSNIIKRLDFPVIVKGRYYDAHKAFNKDDIEKYFNQIQAKWGLPIILQEFLSGEEINIAAIGDGKGNIISAVQVKKIVVSEKGKGFASVVIKDPSLDKFTKYVVKCLNWRGPMELEILKTFKNDKLYLLEINPRLPAWILLASGAGQNLPLFLVNLALGKKVIPPENYEVGKIFIRHSEDIVLDIATVGELTSLNYLADLRTIPVSQRKYNFNETKGN